MADYVFFYGTLLPSHAPREVAQTVKQLRRIGRGAVRGRLYDLGQYPGLKLDSTARTTVKGQVFEVPAKNVLRLLDRYEGFRRSRPSRSLFIRRRSPVRLDRNRILNCWLYEYNKRPSEATRIPQGRFRRARAAS